MINLRFPPLLRLGSTWMHISWWACRDIGQSAVVPTEQKAGCPGWQLLCWAKNRASLRTKPFRLWKPTHIASHHSFTVTLKGKELVAQSGLTLLDPMDYSLPGSSVHGILQARILEWVAIPISRRSSPPRDWTLVFCIAGRFFTSEPPGTVTLLRHC